MNARLSVTNSASAARYRGLHGRSAQLQTRTQKRGLVCAPSAAVAEVVETEVYEGVTEGYWTWKGHKIRYQRSGDAGPAVLLVHGFGANADHWRKNTPVLGKKHRTYAIDLLGYGFSDKPDPRLQPTNAIYNFANWGSQLNDFIDEKIGEPTFIIANSVGGLAGLEASIARPDMVKGVQLMDISLRMLHVERQNPYARPFIAALQRLLRETDIGRSFFGSVAQPRTLKNILREAYGVKEAVTDELIDKMLKPGLTPGAVEVFLDFISYSGGPLPEQLIEKNTVPVSILWGEADPWEDHVKGKELFANYPCVKEFILLPGIGHCPMDEAPQIVNPLIAKFVADFA